MKYTCGVIKDLLPLYLDGVCSEESKKAIETHLSECSDCKEFYTAMREADRMEIDTRSAERERQKAASFQTVKKKLLRKQIIAAFASVAVLVVIVFAAVNILKSAAVDVVEYEDNISVSMADGSIIGRLQGSRINQMRCKRVTVTTEGQEENYLFFYVAETKWDRLTTSFDVFSECTLCFSDKGAEQIDAVYYYTGEYKGIETMSREELQTVIDASVILWQK